MPINTMIRQLEQELIEVLNKYDFPAALKRLVVGTIFSELKALETEAISEESAHPQAPDVTEDEHDN